MKSNETAEELMLPTTYIEQKHATIGYVAQPLVEGLRVRYVPNVGFLERDGHVVNFYGIEEIKPYPGYEFDGCLYIPGVPEERITQVIRRDCRDLDPTKVRFAIFDLPKVSGDALKRSALLSCIPETPRCTKLPSRDMVTKDTCAQRKRNQFQAWSALGYDGATFRCGEYTPGRSENLKEFRLYKRGEYTLVKADETTWLFKTESGTLFTIPKPPHSSSDVILGDKFLIRYRGLLRNAIPFRPELIFT